uniref:Uncharacterized protein n=1 Tax=Glossina austeni TaxID=7395 RepID=A0A1A9VED5_GLOAU
MSRLVAIELEVLVLDYARVFAADTIATVFSSVTFNSLFINSLYMASLTSYILTVSILVRLYSVCVVYDFKTKWRVEEKVCDALTHRWLQNVDKISPTLWRV